MTKQYDTQEQIDAFDIYVKQNPDGRQVHHTGTLGYDDGEWKAFQAGWNAALDQPPYRAVKAYHEGKPVYVTSRPRTFDDYGNKIT